MKIRILFFFFCLLTTSLSGQKTTTTDEQTWFGVFSQTRFNDKWGIWFDAHLRLREDYFGDLGQAIIRGGPMYYLTEDVRLTAAYAYVHNFPALGHAEIVRPEHRPWQQIQWLARWPAVRVTQWLRLEQRFVRKLLSDTDLGDGYLFTGRIRYNAVLFFPLTAKRFEPGGLQFTLNNELFINFGKNIVYNHFDQNRFFAGLVYLFSKHAQLQAGYMNLYQQLASGNQFRNQHTIRIFYFHNFDLRK